MPIKHYRREIASVEPNNTDPRFSQSVRLTMDAPGSTVVQSASTVCTGIKKTLDFHIEDTKTNQHAAIQSGIDCYLYPGEYATVDYKDVSSENYIESGLDIQNLLY